MIPKKIHYVWMGKGQKSELILNCIKSWKENLIDYEIIEWNEENFNINSNSYVKEAYENKKWAFVSDYIRIYVLYNFGGVYLDTDVEILKPIDKFLEHSAFCGFESTAYISTAIIGAQKGHPWTRELLQYYNDRSFIHSDGSFDLTPNVTHITRTTIDQYGLNLENQYQKLKEDLHIYPKDFFSPSDYGDSMKQKNNKITENSYCIHHYIGSWLNFPGKIKVRIRNLFGITYIKKLKK